MPELPEVEAARRAIQENCIGRVIKRSIIANDPKVIEAVSSKDFEAALAGKTVVAALRKGKNMWLQLDSPPFPSFQFGMAGAIYIKGVAITKYKRSAVNETDEWPSKYSKVFIELDDGLELSFTDKRRFAKVRLLEDPSSAPPICELGPDALLEPLTVDGLYDSLNKKKIGIKAVLLDQSFISGIGNWIADEVLYQARIHPLQITSSLSRQSCATLHKCIKEVIQFAVGVDADCSRLPLEWLFHCRWGRKPGKIDGRKIEFITAGGRTTAYVPELQKLSGSQATKILKKPKKRSTKNSDGKGDASDDELENEGEREAVTVEAKSGRKTTKKGGMNLTQKKKTDKSEKSSADDDYDDNDENQNKGKKPPSKRKAKRNGNNVYGIQKKKDNGKNSCTKRESDEDDGDDHDNVSVGGDDDDEYEKIATKKNQKGAKTTKQTKKVAK